MMDFNDAFSATMAREGGYVLHKVAGDTGGQTYAGISRNNNRDWPGWGIIDSGGVPPTSMVRDYYYKGYWLPLSGESLRYDIAASIFDFAVNTSAAGNYPKPAHKLAQIVARVEPDGMIGPVSVQALNAISPDSFALGYLAAKLKRYSDIVAGNPSQIKFLRGWLNRSLGALA